MYSRPLRRHRDHRDAHRFFDQVDDVDCIHSEIQRFKSPMQEKRDEQNSSLPCVVGISDCSRSKVDNVHKCIISRWYDPSRWLLLRHRYTGNETNNRYRLDPIELMRYVWYYPESSEKRNGSLEKETRFAYIQLLVIIADRGIIRHHEINLK